MIALRHVLNAERDAELQAYTAEVEAELRARFAGCDRTALAAVPALQAYANYYRRFAKTYHVRLQLESVVFKGRPITSPNAIVQTMFAVELRNLLLTAAHDLSFVRGGLTVDAAAGWERYQGLDGGELALKPSDMYIRDEEGILSSILYGPDRRTRVRLQTQSVVFTVYAPAGISRDQLEAHLSNLESVVRLFSPGATLDTCEVLVTGR